MEEYANMLGTTLSKTGCAKGSLILRCCCEKAKTLCKQRQKKQRIDYNH